MCRRNDQDAYSEREGLPPRPALLHRYYRDHRDQPLAYRRTRLIQPPHQSPIRADANAINTAHKSELACTVDSQYSYCHGPGAEL